MIEILIRAEDGLSREVVKHLNHIEEQILESLAWKMESPLWDKIKENENKVPTCEEVKDMVLFFGFFLTSTKIFFKKTQKLEMSKRLGAVGILRQQYLNTYNIVTKYFALSGNATSIF